MKTLLLIRHAKAESPFSINDFDRALADRGKKDAADMAVRIRKKITTIDAFVSSPAKRAKKTGEIFAAAYKKKPDELILVTSLYQATTEIFASVVSDLDDRFDTVALFSHNPGITYFAGTLSAVKIDHMPTSAVFAVRMENDHWKNFAKAKKGFILFEWPGN